MVIPSARSIVSMRPTLARTDTTSAGMAAFLDVIFTAGGYDTLARMFNSLELSMDDDIPELMSRYAELF